MYKRDIATGHIWPGLKAAGITPDYFEWNHLRVIEIGGAKAEERLQEEYARAVQAGASADKLAFIKKQIRANKEMMSEGIKAKIEQIKQWRAAEQAPHQSQRDGMKDYLDSTYSF